MGKGKTMPVRISEEALAVAKVAAAFANQSVMEWLSNLVMAHGPQEVAEGSRRMAERTATPQAEPGQPQRPRRRKAGAGEE
jgi:hypothetical protein